MLSDRDTEKMAEAADWSTQFDPPRHFPVRHRYEKRSDPGNTAAWVVVGIVAAILLVVAYQKVSESGYFRGITLAKFHQVQRGMTYEEVCDIAGKRGELLDSGGGEFGDFKMYAAAYVWRDGDGGQMRVAFINGKAIGKAQSGLR